MAEVQPFVATRFAETKPERLANLVTPPYDVIDRKYQDALYDADPHNLVRIDFGRVMPDDGDEENRYTRAGALWTEWKRKHVVEEDHRKSFYVYEQEFKLPGGSVVKRRGFFAAVKLQDFSEGGVRAHEHTFDGPKADRFRLMRATDCNMSPIFCVYNDPSMSVDKILEEAASKKPAQEAEFDGVVNRLWVVDSKPQTQAITEAMRAQTLFIADGHHRYETSLNYRDAMREVGEKHTGNEPFDYTLMYLNNIHDPGLAVLPTHRVICRDACSGVDIDEVMEDLSEYFDIEEIAIDNENIEGEASRLTDLMAKSGERTITITMVMPKNRAYLLKLKDGADLDEMIDEEGVHVSIKSLDVTILHSFIISRAWLGNPEIELDDDEVCYVKDASDVLTRMAGCKYGVAFMLNPTKIGQVCEAAEAGQRMPHKSTYFYPKLVTGMVIRDMTAPW